MERGNFRQKNSYVSPDWDESWRGDKGIDLFCRRRRSFPSGSVVKNLPAVKEPWVREIPWRRAWQPTPVFLPGESPWIEKPGGLQSIESQRVKHD